MSEIKGTRALELWCKRLTKECPFVKIENMTTSWRNGIAFCALVHYFKPDLIDLSQLNPENIYENNQLAFKIAEKHLGIPSLLDPEDMVANEVPDRLSILTYLSQFYQRLGHTVSTKNSSNDGNTESTIENSSLSFRKNALDYCEVCNLPVYLAQRLRVSNRLYHRRCFCCSKCLGYLNPKNYQIGESAQLLCDSCKNYEPVYSSKHNQIGMLAFTDQTDSTNETKIQEASSHEDCSKSETVVDKINKFENLNEIKKLSDKYKNISVDDMVLKIEKECGSSILEKEKVDSITSKDSKTYDNTVYENTNEKDVCIHPPKSSNISGNSYKSDQKDESIEKVSHSNITDDNRMARHYFESIEPEKEFLKTNKSDVINLEESKEEPSEKQVENEDSSVSENKQTIKYPVNLNPFSDDDDDEEEIINNSKKNSTNPFECSDEEDSSPSKNQIHVPKINKPGVRELTSYNPFSSDDEEATTDDESSKQISSMSKSQLTSSTPKSSKIPHHKKRRAPLPPPRITLSPPSLEHHENSMEDVASLSSFSSYTSTINSDQKSTPKSRKKKPAPTPPESMSASFCNFNNDKDSLKNENTSDSLNRKAKGPAPGLPLPDRREVKLQMSADELQIQLDMLETQQIGLEKQGVLIEQMIRDKCEVENAEPPPQEEIEDLVIQLCELVNEKNDLFRKQTELMYIRRQQRLEQEQADIEHEIRVLQSRPAVNRIDADKVREEQLVARLVEVVAARDRLVQQAEAERRRERDEDRALAATIAQKRAERNSDASAKKPSETANTPKKNKMKDKMKKQLKKAKHTLIPKKKDDTNESKEKLTKHDDKGNK